MTSSPRSGRSACDGLVSVSGYLIGSQEAGKLPLPPEAEHAVVVPVLLRHRARPGRLRQVPARLCEADLADRVAEVELRRRHLRSQRGILRQPGSRRDRDSQLSLAAGAGRRRASLRRARRSGSPKAPSSPCPRSRSRATPTAHHIRIRAPTPRSSRARIRTGPSRAASDTTFPRKPRRRSPTPSSTSAACEMSLFGVRRHPGATPCPARATCPASTARPAGSTRRRSPSEEPAREGRPRRLLDVHVHQLAAHARLRPRVGREVPRITGLVVVGVHTPEFPFEQGRRQRPPGRQGHAGRVPDRLDSDYGVWRDFANRYWPAVYIADARRTASSASGRLEPSSLAPEPPGPESVSSRVPLPSNATSIRTRTWGERHRVSRHTPVWVWTRDPMPSDGECVPGRRARPTGWAGRSRCRSRGSHRSSPGCRR